MSNALIVAPRPAIEQTDISQRKALWEKTAEETLRPMIERLSITWNARLALTCIEAAYAENHFIVKQARFAVIETTTKGFWGRINNEVVAELRIDHLGFNRLTLKESLTAFRPKDREPLFTIECFPNKGDEKFMCAMLDAERRKLLRLHA